MRDELPNYVLDPGEVFAERYIIERLLGEGERKRTYLARDQLLRRHVALALVKPQAADRDPNATSREVDRLAQAGAHAHLVSLHHAATSNGLEYLVFEHMPGGDLEDRCRRVWEMQEQLTLDEILRYGRQLCRALSHIHSKRLIHLDVSPRNVWLDEYGAAHLGDFDTAVSLDHPGQLPEPLVSATSILFQRFVEDTRPAWRRPRAGRRSPDCRHHRRVQVNGTPHC